MSGMDRRRFFKVTAITGTSAALAGCGNPEHQLMRFVPEEEITPGIATWKPSVCPLCSAGCGVLARVMDGDAEVFRNGQPGVTRMGLPRKLEGDPEHPVSQGRLCVRGQAALQVTYHPDRIATPLKRRGERGSGTFDEVSWDDALADLAGRVDTLVAQGQASAIAFLGRPRSGRRPALVADFLQRLGAPPRWPSSSSTTRCAAAPMPPASGAISCPRSTWRTRTTSLAWALTSSAPGTRRWRRTPPTAACVRASRACVPSSCRSNRASRRPAPVPTNGWRCVLAPRARWRSGWRM